MSANRDIKRVMVVDDCRDTLFLHRYFINCIAEHIVVDSYWNVDAAIEELKKFQSEANFPDLILCDINLPLKDGYAFIKEYQAYNFHEKHQGTLVIFQSCWVNAQAKSKLAKLGKQYMLIEKASNQEGFERILQMKKGYSETEGTCLLAV